VDDFELGFSGNVTGSGPCSAATVSKVWGNEATNKWGPSTL